MTELENYIQSYFGVDNNQLATIASLFKDTTLQKDEFFTQAGSYCDKLSFIQSGHIRVFAHTDKKEVTQWLASKGEFITDLSSLIFNTPSRWDIQALSDCQLYTIYKEDYQRIGSLVPKWDQLEKMFLAKCFITLEDRVFSFLSMTAEERFQFLFNYKSEIFNEVPLHYIASMLGMTPETLSRIRNKRIG